MHVTLHSQKKNAKSNSQKQLNLYTQNTKHSEICIHTCLFM